MYPLDKGQIGKVFVRMFDSAGDPVTGVTSPTITMSKNGASFAAPSDGTWAELAGGWYVVALDADDTDTVGALGLRVVKAGCVDGAATVYVRDITAIAAAVWQRVLSTAGGSSLSAEKIMRLLDAAQGGKVSGVGSGTVTIRNSEDTKDVVTATVDCCGNRMNIVLDLT